MIWLLLVYGGSSAASDVRAPYDPSATLAMVTILFGVPMGVFLLLGIHSLIEYIERRGWRPKNKQRKPNDRR